jgi:hypothetical protein
MQSNAAAPTPVRLDRIAALAQMVEVAKDAAYAHLEFSRQIGNRYPRAVPKNSGEQVEPIDALHEWSAVTIR